MLLMILCVFENPTELETDFYYTDNDSSTGTPSIQKVYDELLKVRKALIQKIH